MLMREVFDPGFSAHRQLIRFIKIKHQHKQSVDQQKITSLINIYSTGLANRRERSENDQLLHFD